MPLPGGGTAVEAPGGGGWVICNGSCNGGGNPGGGGAANNTPTPQCTAAQKAAATLANLFDTASSQSGWIAFGTGALVLAGVGEEATFGLDTPATIAAAPVTSFFATTSTVTGASRLA